MSITDELARLEDQWRAGSLTDEEFQRAKERVLGDNGPPPAPQADDRRTNEMAMWLHLSALCGFVIAGAGFVAPIVIWQMKKDELPGIDAHGKRVTNWLISYAIYVAVSFLLAFVFIGIPMLIVLGILGFVFPLIAGLKANKGESWEYPLSMKFLD